MCWFYDPAVIKFSLCYQAEDVSVLLFVDDVVLLASSAPEWFTAECEAAEVRASASKAEAEVLCQIVERSLWVE